MRAWGEVSPEDVQEIINAPAGKAAEIIRKYDPAWGRTGEEVYEVHFVKKITEYHNCKVKISAASQEDADKIADGLLKNRYKANSPIQFEYFADSEDEEIYVEWVEKE